MMAGSLLSAMEAVATSDPGRIVLDIREKGQWRSVTASAMHEAVLAWAGVFTSRGLDRGSVVFIVLEHRLALYPVFLGAMRAGLIPSFLPFPTSKQDPAHYWASHKALLERVAPSAVVTYDRNLGPISEILPDRGCALIDVDLAIEDSRADVRLPPLGEVETDETIALLQHSSGTTGLKKGVALTYGQIARQVTSYASRLSAGERDCVVSWLPLYHDMGLISSFLMPFTLGCRIISIGAFDWLARPDDLLRLIAEHRATLCWMPNFALNHLIRTRDKKGSYDLSSMRAIIGCSEPCRAETFERFDAAFAVHGLAPNTLQVCYAMAEAVFAVTQTDLERPPRVVDVDSAALTGSRRVVPVSPGTPGAARFVSCGRAVDGIEVRIHAAGTDDTGEIQLRGAFVFDAYYRNDEATGTAFEDGWYRTGDIGFAADGEIFVCGRLKELLIVHGRNYYANDIEAIVSEVEGVKPGRVVAFGVSDGVTASEEAVVLAESLTDDATTHPAVEKRIKQAVFDRLELALKRVVVVPPGHVVKTTSGKVSRKENIERYVAGLAAV